MLIPNRHGGGVFTPLVFSPSLWLDASDSTTLFQLSDGTVPATTNADPVGYWGDKSGNDRHVVQATLGDRPTLRTAVQNSLNVLRFDGSSDVLSHATTFDQQAWYVVAKYSATTFGGFHGLLTSMGQVATSLVFIGNGGTVNWFTADGAMINATGYKDGTFYSPSLGALSFPGPMNAFANMSMTQAAVRTQNLQVGRDRDLSRFWNGDVCEALVFPAALSVGGDALIRGYLQSRWGTP